MGDMADDAYEMDILWKLESFEGDCGTEISDSYYNKKESGPGRCPKCQGKTSLIEGKFGKFYGCLNFPKCKGSRNG